MRHLIHLMVVFIVIGCVFTFDGLADDQKGDGGEVTDIEEISLSDLLDQEVTVVSKKSQRVEEAPAIISVLTKKEMLERGYQNLYDALNSLPGVNSQETYFGYNQVFFRGIYSTLYNDKTLVLINGNPFWDSIQGSHYIEAFPIEAVKRLEVIRGPGSTLYGTNAFAGVINIVTETGADIKGKASGYIRLGSYTTFEAGLTAGNYKDDVSWLLNVAWRNTNGYPVENPADELGNPFQYDAELNYKSLYGEFAYKNLKFSTYTFFQEKTKIDALPINFGSHKNTTNDFMGTLWMMEYTHHLKNEKGSLKVRGSYNYFDKEFNFLYLSNSPTPNLDLLPSPEALFIIAPTMVDGNGYRYDVEANFDYTVSDSFDLMVGAGYESWQADSPKITHRLTGQIIGELTEGDSTDNSLFAFAQGTFSLGKNIQAVAGARYVYNKDFGSFLNPRGGLVFKPAKSLYIKALYGSAFRSPTMNEKYLQFGIAEGNPDLDPEKLKTFEVGIDYVMKKTNIRLNFYHTMIDDLIDREHLADGSGRTRYINLGGTSKYTGVEGEIRGVLTKNIRYYLNAFVGKGKDQAGNDIKYIPSFIQNGGITFKNSIFLASVYYSYMDSVENQYKSFLQSLMSPFVPDQTAKIDSAFLLNAKVGITLRKQLTISLIGHNLTDKQVMAPEFVRRFIPSMQNGPGRTVYVEIRKSF